VLPGDHYAIVRPPAVAALAAVVRRLLAGSGCNRRHGAGSEIGTGRCSAHPAGTIPVVESIERP
jgi:hypothetical protein